MKYSPKQRLNPKRSQELFDGVFGVVFLLVCFVRDGVVLQEETAPGNIKQENWD